MDCFVPLAMTKESQTHRLQITHLVGYLGRHGAAHSAPRRRLTSTSIQNASQPRVGPMPSIVA